MKRSKSVLVGLCTVSLVLTGCGDSNSPPSNRMPIVLPSQLPAEMQKAIPAYKVGDNPSGEKPPMNAYSENLGYYHESCSQWFPYPYDYYDHRWGYYRCGKWSRYNSSRSHYHTPGVGSRLVGGAIRTGAELVGATMARGPSTPGQNFSSTGVSGSFGNGTGPSTPPPMPQSPPPMPSSSQRSTPPPMPDYDAQPSGSPNHSGVAHSNATATRTNNVNRGGFGSTGRSASSSSGSGFHSSSSGS